MKKLLILILIFSFQSLTKADDIREFELEGISIGDNLFNHITKEQFKDWEEFKYYYKGNKYVVVPCIYPSVQYDQIGCTIKIAEDENHKIVGVHGTIKFPDNISACLKKKDDVQKEFKEILKDSIIEDMGTYLHGGDPTGNSTQTVVDFNFINGGYIRVVCHDWSKELAKEGWTDEFKVYITSKELQNFINNEAYN
tara:strand:- start:688 stop:1275 length:588 start_codon:yes stop_codon:yes gene_type:complete